MLDFKGAIGFLCILINKFKSIKKISKIQFEKDFRYGKLIVKALTQVKSFLNFYSVQKNIKIYTKIQRPRFQIAGKG